MFLTPALIRRFPLEFTLQRVPTKNSLAVAGLDSNVQNFRDAGDVAFYTSHPMKLPLLLCKLPG